MPISHAVVGLVDDAGLVPPTALSMTDALARHRGDDACGSPVLTDRLLVPASRVDELLAALDDAPLQVGLVVDVPLDDIAALAERLSTDPRTTLSALEIRLGTHTVEDVTRAVAGLPTRVAVHVEVPLDDALDTHLAQLGEARLGAAVRCGGEQAAQLPTAEQLARFLQGAVREVVPFRATAGPQRAVRRTDPATGFEHHGFLNLLVATQRAVECRPTPEIIAALLSTDGDRLAHDVTVADPLLDDQAREYFVAVGASDTRAPRADLVELGLA